MCDALSVHELIRSTFTTDISVKECRLHIQDQSDILGDERRDGILSSWTVAKQKDDGEHSPPVCTDVPS